jgi:hypothetical protein
MTSSLIYKKRVNINLLLSEVKSEEDNDNFDDKSIANIETDGKEDIDNFDDKSIANIESVDKVVILSI